MGIPGSWGSKLHVASYIECNCTCYTDLASLESIMSVILYAFLACLHRCVTCSNPQLSKLGVILASVLQQSYSLIPRPSLAPVYEHLFCVLQNWRWG